MLTEFTEFVMTRTLFTNVTFVTMCGSLKKPVISNVTKKVFMKTYVMTVTSATKVSDVKAIERHMLEIFIMTKTGFTCVTFVTTAKSLKTPATSSDTKNVFMKVYDSMVVAFVT